MTQNSNSIARVMLRITSVTHFLLLLLLLVAAANVSIVSSFCTNINHHIISHTTHSNSISQRAPINSSVNIQQLLQAAAHSNDPSDSRIDIHLNEDEQQQQNDGSNTNSNNSDGSPKDIFKSSSSLVTRRTIMQTIIASSIFQTPQNAIASTTPTTADATTPINLKCLLDLPPPPPNRNTIRLYLCRHGQTENNRLGLMQGSRIDAPLNDTGKRMAVRLGKALSYLEPLGGGIPTVAAHSNLRRARETAVIAAATIATVGSSKGRVSSSSRRDDASQTNRKSEEEEEEESILQLVEPTLTTDTTNNNKTNNNKKNNWMSTNYIPSLNEVDFGPINEGKPVKLAKANMYKTYSTWGLGIIDSTPEGGGETGRQVLERASDALTQLKDLAKTSGSTGGSSRAVMAVSHGVYLRVILAVAKEVSLLEASQYKQNNCCINVLDVDLEETVVIGPKSSLFGGSLSLAPKDFEIVIPRVEVVRMNEVRHLKDLLPV